MPRFCPMCGAGTAPQAKFGSECGSRLSRTAAPVDPQAVTVEPEIPLEGFTIRFLFSSSANYEFAVSRAEQSAQYIRFGQGKQITHQATYAATDLDQMRGLLDALKGFRNRKVWVDGELSSWDDAFGWLWCYNRRHSSYNPDLYCFGDEDQRLNLWGCINSGMPFGGYSRWLTYGKFEGDGSFVLDKDRIRHEVRTNLHRFRFCPAIDLELAEQIVDALPVKVNPKKDRNWQYQQSFGSSLRAPDSMMNVTVREGGISYEMTIKGVGPANLLAAEEIYSRVKRRLPSGGKFELADRDT